MVSVGDHGGREEGKTTPSALAFSRGEEKTKARVKEKE